MRASELRKEKCYIPNYETLSSVKQTLILRVVKKLENVEFKNQQSPIY